MICDYDVTWDHINQTDQFNALQCNAMQCKTIQYKPIQCNRIPYLTIWYNIHRTPCRSYGCEGHTVNSPLSLSLSAVNCPLSLSTSKKSADSRQCVVYSTFLEWFRQGRSRNKCLSKKNPSCLAALQTILNKWSERKQTSKSAVSFQEASCRHSP